MTQGAVRPTDSRRRRSIGEGRCDSCRSLVKIEVRWSAARGVQSRRSIVPAGNVTPLRCWRRGRTLAHLRLGCNGCWRRRNDRTHAGRRRRRRSRACRGAVGIVSSIRRVRLILPLSWLVRTRSGIGIGGRSIRVRSGGPRIMSINAVCDIFGRSSNWLRTRYGGGSPTTSRSTVCRILIRWLASRLSGELGLGNHSRGLRCRSQ